jgi:putative Ig domain-containing protein
MAIGLKKIVRALTAGSLLFGGALTASVLVDTLPTSAVTVVQTIPVGTIPDAVSSDGTHVWVAIEGANTVTELTATPPAAPSITSSSSDVITEGLPDSFTVTTTGSPTPAITETGALPSGVTFVDNGDETATLSGTPGPGTGGTYPITLTASNGVPPDATQSFVLAVDEAPAISSANNATFTVGAAGNFSFTTSTGFPTPSWSESGALPSGVTFTDTGNGTAVLTGTPTSGTVGTYSIIVSASNGVTPNAVQNFTLMVATPSITSVTPSQLAQGAKASTVVIQETGSVSPVVVTISGGGVTPSLVSVTPTAVTISAKVSATALIGARNVTVAAANGSATCTGCLTITPAPTLISANPSQMAVGASGSVTFTGSGLQTGATVKIHGPSTKVTAVSSSIVATGATLTATISAPKETLAGAYTVTVTNADRSTATCTGCLAVIAAPTLASMSPASAAPGTTTPVTLTGTGFAGATLEGPTGVTFTNVTVVNPNTITATMNVSSSAPTGSKLPVTVTNNAAAGYGQVRSDVLSVTSPGINTSPEILYMTDQYTATNCAGVQSGDLHYVVISPTTPGPHPIVFGMHGSGFKGTAGCNGKLPLYRDFDKDLIPWVQAGYVAVNIEYHGYDNGLYGDLTYPGPGQWGTIADGTVELNVKPAVEYFLSHDPGQYGADPLSGMVAFGGSSGAHDAYMLGITGVPGYQFSAVVGWSGLPDSADAGTRVLTDFDTYMRTTDGSDVAWFADPLHRLSSSSPPQYIANGLNEFIDPQNALVYQQACVNLLGAGNCWLRIPNTSGHATAYADYPFTGIAPEYTQPAATVGQTVEEDSIAFASRYVDLTG